MFAIYTQDRQIVTVGPDTRLHLEFSEEEERYNLFAGSWLLYQSEAAAPDSAQRLLDALFAAMLEGKRGFDVRAVLDTPAAT